MNLLMMDSVIIITIGIIAFLLGCLFSVVRYQKITVQLENHLSYLQQDLRNIQKENEFYRSEKFRLEKLVEEKQTNWHELHTRYASLHEKTSQQNINSNEWRTENEMLIRAQNELREKFLEKETELREVKIRSEESAISLEEKQKLLDSNEKHLQAQFENLAQRLFEQGSQKVDEQSRQNMEKTLAPLREQLDGFRKQINESFGEEARERHTLAFEIRNLQEMNSKMAQEAVNLTRALKGDNKTQGNWGEWILSSILEASSLREGHEYHTQVSMSTAQGERKQPDVVVHLPNERDVIIDSKVSLLAYERYFNGDNEIDESARGAALSEHIASLRNHIRQLGRKDYTALPDIRTLDYVLMFVPVEPAFILAIEHQPDLVNEALKQGVMMVSPTTLLVALRTIKYLWSSEYQNQNAQEIATRAAALYDKVRLFVEEMASVGQGLDKAQGHYQQAMSRLSSGRNNIIHQVESFRALGIDVKKGISSDVVKTLPIREADRFQITAGKF